MLVVSAPAHATELPDAEEEAACLTIVVGQLVLLPASGIAKFWVEWNPPCCIVKSLVIVSLQADANGNYQYWYQEYGGTTTRHLCEL